MLNGIAHDPLTDTWLLTGKHWPWMFEVAFDCVAGCTGETVSVLTGATRVQTAVAIAQDRFPPDDSADAAVLARSDGYADAVAGTPLAAAVDGPVLLTPGEELHPDTAAELTRVLPAGATVYLLGGTGALGAEVEEQVRALGLTVRRLAGRDPLRDRHRGRGRGRRRRGRTGGDVPRDRAWTSRTRWSPGQRPGPRAACSCSATVPSHTPRPTRGC